MSLTVAYIIIAALAVLTVFLLAVESRPWIQTQSRRIDGDVEFLRSIPASVEREDI